MLRGKVRFPNKPVPKKIVVGSLEPQGLSEVTFNKKQGSLKSLLKETKAKLER